MFKPARILLFERPPLLRLVIVIAIAALSARSGMAGYVVYSWSGTLIPHGIEDPWLIGSAGKPFDIQISVSTDAPDGIDQSIEYAGFFADHVDFRLADVAVPVSGDLYIDFADNQANLVDLTSFAGNFELLGQSLDIGTVIELPIDTFSFSQELERPPTFSQTATLDRGAFGTQYYTGIVTKGAPVQAVPEGDSLLAIGFVATALYFATRKQRD